MNQDPPDHLVLLAITEAEGTLDHQDHKAVQVRNFNLSSISFCIVASPRVAHISLSVSSPPELLRTL